MGCRYSYIWTAEVWLYLAIVLDHFSCRIVGWAVSDRLKKDLVLSALQRRSSCASQGQAFCITLIVAASIARIITGGCSTGTALSPQ
jgi:hypothetical protein